MDVPKPAVDEKGAPINGQPQVSPDRLYMQLLVFGDCEDTGSVIEAVKASRIEAVVYQELNDPRGVGLLTWSTDPGHFIERVQPMLRDSALADLHIKDEFTMFGRSYSLGHEANLKDWLIDKPRATALNPETPWCVFYPLRRKGAFTTLDEQAQRQILMEHAKIGMAYVQHGLGYDIRLACHGLDKNDNDFVIGLIGSNLAWLSKLVENMRKTTQTSQYIEHLGPFFVGRVLYQSKL
jgi:chlorite dismutase